MTEVGAPIRYRTDQTLEGSRVAHDGRIAEGLEPFNLDHARA